MFTSVPEVVHVPDICKSRFTYTEYILNRHRTCLKIFIFTYSREDVHLPDTVVGVTVKNAVFRIGIEKVKIMCAFLVEKVNTCPRLTVLVGLLLE